jgi:aspartate/methionine/tyrosine aminotransferase
VAAGYPHTGAGADRVIITAGSQECCIFALTTLVDEGDEVLVRPRVHRYPTIVHGGGRRSLRPPAARTSRLDIDDSGGSFAADRVGISPSNPTGRVLAGGLGRWPRHSMGTAAR